MDEFEEQRNKENLTAELLNREKVRSRTLIGFKNSKFEYNYILYEHHYKFRENTQIREFVWFHGIFKNDNNFQNFRENTQIREFCVISQNF